MCKEFLLFSGGRCSRFVQVFKALLKLELGVECMELLEEGWKIMHRQYITDMRGDYNRMQDVPLLRDWINSHDRYEEPPEHEELHVPEEFYSINYSTPYFLFLNTL